MVSGFSGVEKRWLGREWNLPIDVIVVAVSLLPRRTSPFSPPHVLGHWGASNNGTTLKEKDYPFISGSLP